jgi:hypothetical protein
MTKDPWKELGKIVDNSTTTVYIKTPKGWKCKRKGCQADYKHTHSTYTCLSKGILEDFYNSIENSKDKPTYVYFQGTKYKTGSKPLKLALDKWYKQHKNQK